MCLKSWSPSDWAAWAQAIAATAAIYFSAKFGRDQSKAQYKNSRKLQKQEARNQEIVLTDAVTEIIKNTDQRVKYVEERLSSREALDNVINKTVYFDLDCLTEVLDSLKQIPLKDLPSAKLVTNVMHLTSAVRQLEIQMEKALNEYREMSAEDFQKFFLTLDQIKTSTSKIYNETEEYLNNLKVVASDF
jgi:hypothetical protein